MQINIIDFKIETDRLKLIPTSEKFAKEMFREFTKEITKFMYPKSPSSIDETLSFIKISKEKMSKGEELQVVILNKTTGEFLGHGGINNLNTDTPEPGIWIKKGAHGNKYGAETVKGLKEWIDKNLKYKYLLYPVDKKNIASRKIAESLGGIIETEYIKTGMSGNILDMVEYRIYPTD
jgi:RimJ/RimL family protein N-acetyltransferase